MKNEFETAQGKEREERTLTLRQLLENRIDTLSSGIPHRTEPIARHRPRDRAGKIREDEAHRSTAHAAHQAPELTRRCGPRALRHAFLAQHLLEYVAKLGVAGSLLLVGGGGTESEGGPREIETAAAAAAAAGRGAAVGTGNFFIGVVGGVGGKGVVGAGGVVVSAPDGIGEGVVGVVYSLEFFGPCGAFG